ncbi:leucine-rich repeat protein [Tanacetum coccineum]
MGPVHMHILHMPISGLDPDHPNCNKLKASKVSENGVSGKEANRLSGPKQYSILGEGWGWLRKHGSLLVRSTNISLQPFQYTVTLHDEFAASSSLFEYFNNFWSEFQWDDDLEYCNALDYLHDCCQTMITHGHLKPSNILLDADMVAHVRDFGLTQLLGTDLNKNISTGVKGIIGYAPPEYGLESRMTSSGDVYSFGILLLKVMTGKRPTDYMFKDGLSLHKFSYMAFPNHLIDVINDDVIVLQSTEANAKKVEECLAATMKIRVSCSVDSPSQRMKIDTVVNELQRILDVLQNI